MYKKKITIDDVVNVFKGVSVNKLTIINDYVIKHCGHSDKNYTSLERYYCYVPIFDIVDERAKQAIKAFKKGKISKEYFNSLDVFECTSHTIKIFNKLFDIDLIMENCEENHQIIVLDWNKFCKN